MKKKLFCGVCGRVMIKAFTDPNTYRERDMRGDIIETVHVYYGCPNDCCKTVARLRFRKDGAPGDQYLLGKARRNAPDCVTDLPGNPKELVG